MTASTSDPITTACRSLDDERCDPAETVELAVGDRPGREHATSDLLLRVLDGIAYVELDEDERALTPGDEATVGRGLPVRLFNAGDTRLRFERCSCPA